MSRALIVVGLPILVLAPFDALGGAAPHQQPPPAAQVRVKTPSSRLAAGSTLRSGSVLASPTGRYRLAMQADGNLVLFEAGHALWSSRTSGHRGAVATMQSDGNFVIYQEHRAIWSSGTSRGGRHAYYLVVETDGDVVIFTPANRPIWETHTSVARELSPGSTPLRAPRRATTS